MAQQESETSVSTTWWELNPNLLTPPSWSNMNPCHPPNHNNMLYSCEEAISIPNSFNSVSSTQSGLTMYHSLHELVESSSSTPENHLWGQPLLSVGTGVGLHHNHDYGANFLEALPSKHPTTELFEPACDYLKKLDTGWEFTNPTSHVEKQLNRYDGRMVDHDRQANTPDIVRNWSIAPPHQQFDQQITPKMHSLSLTSSIAQGLDSILDQMKQEQPNFSAYPSNSGYLPCYGHDDLKGGNQFQGMEASESSFPRSTDGGSGGYQMALRNPAIGDNKYYYGMSDVAWSNARSLSDHVTFSSCLNEPSVDFQASKPCLKASNSPDSKKQGHDAASATRGTGRGTGITSEGKKKRSEDNSDTLLKRPKHDNSAVSSSKVQAPKVKLGEKITALQQIVSPFGKTDTASVLLEAIGYIKFLQEQVQFLCNPYMKLNANKDHLPWSSSERKDKSESKLDLRSRGLCLVPISCTPRVYRENTGTDYWTPTYRGCLYR